MIHRLRNDHDTRQKLIDKRLNLSRYLRLSLLGIVIAMLKDMDFGVYGKGIDGYIHYSLAMDRIQEEEESRKALMDEFDNDEDNLDSDDLDSDDFGSDDFGGDDF